MNEFMDNLNEIIINNKTFFTDKSVINSKFLKVHLKLKNELGHYFTIFPNNYFYIKQLYKSYMHMKCIYKKYNDHHSSIDSTFKRFIFLATHHKHQMGK